MTERFLLDTSAVLAFTSREPGAGQVERILALATINRCAVDVSAISLTEMFYITLREEGEDLAYLLMALARKWPVAWIYPQEETLLRAGRIKATHRLSLADAIIAATAILRGATLVHKDPELSELAEHVPLLTLPFTKQPDK